MAYYFNNYYCKKCLWDFNAGCSPAGNSEEAERRQEAMKAKNFVAMDFKVNYCPVCGASKPKKVGRYYAMWT